MYNVIILQIQHAHYVPKLMNKKVYQVTSF